MLTAIIAAAGQGSRMGALANKQFIKIAGQPVLARTLLCLKGHADRYILVARPGEEEQVREIAAGILPQFEVVTGGESRQDSVYNGLVAARGSDYVLIHDGARPFASASLIKRVVEAAKSGGAAIPGIPVNDTIKQLSGSLVQTTLTRETLRAVQTPQAFAWDLVFKAHEQARREGFVGTDDASLAEKIGHPVQVVPGEEGNIKITTPEDLHRARLLAGQSPLRVGQGYDVHRLVAGRPLILGGVEIPWELGLLGHSDADVLVHAIMDALLGAAGLGDIGRHFPDTEAAYQGADSLVLLARVRDLVQAQGWLPGNIDAVIIAQRPKLAPYIEQMNQKIAETLQLPVNLVNVKATTTEGLGFAGRGEGIAAQAVCTLVAQ